MERKKRYEMLLRFFLKNPTPTCNLQHRSKFELLISILLSSRTHEESVNKVTRVLFSKVNNPIDMISLGLKEIKKYIHSIGMSNKKSNQILKICTILVKEHQNTVPKNLKKLKSFPGIGNKSAKLMMNIGFDLPLIAVDTHVFRVSNRTGFATGKNIYVLDKKIHAIVPIEFKKSFHLWFFHHGKKVCTKNKPSCYTCFISDLCEFTKKNK